MTLPVHFILFAVRSVPASRKFYQSLGWKVGKRSETDHVCFFQTGKIAVCIYDRATVQESLRAKGEHKDSKAGDIEKAAASEPASKLAKIDGTSDFIVPSVAVGYFTETAEEVQELHDKFVAAGARSIVKPEKTPWGTTTANVADPDDILWEFSSREGMMFDSDGCVDMSL